MALKDEELLSINGGAVKIGIITAVAGLVTFIIGVIDGYLRPLSCHK